MYPQELTAPGNQHEQEGMKLLQKYGVSEKLARFAYTHANWKDATVGLEDLLVALSDNLWKGKRQVELEECFVKTVSARTGKETWEVFAEFDQVCEILTLDADQRIAWQAEFGALFPGDK